MNNYGERGSQEAIEIFMDHATVNRDQDNAELNLDTCFKRLMRCDKDAN